MFASLWLRQLRCRLFGRQSRSSWSKTPPTAGVRPRFRPCLEPLEDRLTPSVDSVQTVATNISTPFSDSSQTVQLTANVTDTTTPSTTVNEGMVQFTLVNGGGQTIGTAASGSVTSNGMATVNYGLPAFTLVGSYTINVSYSDSPSNNFSDGGDTSATLAVNAASTTTTANAATANFSTSASKRDAERHRDQQRRHGQRGQGRLPAF